jgi:hypothetical protein
VISLTDLRRIGRARLRDAEVLHRARRSSGEDYLFPSQLFVPIEVLAKAVPAFALAAMQRLG